MGKIFSTARSKLKETTSAMSKKARILTLTAIVVILAFSIVMAVILNQVNYSTLYYGLSEAEAGKILSILEEQGVDAKVEGSSEILVPEEELSSLRVSLAAQGYPQSGLSYDIFTDGSQFGSTDAETQIRQQYQLQENLRATINAMDKIENSIVIVNLPTQSSYVSSSNKTAASAAVMLSLDVGQTLSNSEARAIAEFIMRSIPSLDVSNISIVDSGMKAYDISESGEEADSTTYSSTQQQLAEQMKSVLSDQILRVLEPALGSGNVAVSVNLALNFDEETVSSVEFAPPLEGASDGLVRSSEVLRDTLRDDGGTGGSAGTDSNGVSGTEYVYEDGDGDDTRSESISEIYNYELNEIQTQIAKAQGAVTGLSVAVVINSEVENAELVLSTVEGLVANAIGVDSDYISVAALPFVEMADMTFSGYLRETQDALKSLNRGEIIKIACICAAILIAIFMILSFIKKYMLPRPSTDAVGAGAEGVDIVIGGDDLTEGEEQERLLNNLIKESATVKKVEDLINSEPEAVVQIIRNWLNDS